MPQKPAHNPKSQRKERKYKATRNKYSRKLTSVTSRWEDSGQISFFVFQLPETCRLPAVSMHYLYNEEKGCNQV